MLRLFPYIIGDKIEDHEDPGWQLYLLLKMLCEYYCAPAFQKTDLSYIQDVLIPTYFQIRPTVLDQTKYSLKPKHHYMVHYAELMLRYGPLLYLWTMSYEQKHKFFKQVMRISKNLINPEYTCAVRHQLQFAHQTLGPLFNDSCQETEPKLLLSENFQGELGDFISQLCLDSEWRESRSVCYNDLEYEVNDVLLLSSHSGTIKGAVLKVIATKDQSVSFVAEIFNCISKEARGLYFLPSQQSKKFAWLPASSLKYPVVQPIYIEEGQRSFSLKHQLLEN
ncbi:GPI ethanolamine phosphate transferase 1 [Frankliniella fusca]|uniref:GPI ethanolamine phosphate transferase 1 n=1 Tax=Frankliniella fusca TaxID=407009 RepID=A0AAE1HRW1_9NEOP|nr:GPI ethanolamine phosphate transferase 1 [Frankliniella fusca]